MKSLIIEGTAKTPEVKLDPEANVFRISGKSIPSDADLFFEPILDWFEEYSKEPNPKTRLVIDLDFFNISTSKRLLFVMYKLHELMDEGHDVELQWCFNEQDDDMYEVGQDYAFMVKIPFSFEKKKHLVAV